MSPQFTRIAYCAVLSVVLSVCCILALRQRTIRQHHSVWQLKQFGVIVKVDDNRLAQGRFQYILFGDDSYNHIHSIQITRDLPVGLLTSLRQIEGAKKIFINNCDNADEILSGINCMSSVESISVTDSTITREGVQSIARFPELSTLNLILLRESPEGLDSLSRLRNLRTICLNGANVTDLTLKSLGGIHSLKNLTIWNSSVTDEGVRDFRRHDPLTQLSIESSRAKPSK